MPNQLYREPLYLIVREVFLDQFLRSSGIHLTLALPLA
jgi:hypothetical protein